jgi:hypothetical protein
MKETNKEHKNKLYEETDTKEQIQQKISDKSQKMHIRELMDDGTATNTQWQMNENYIEALRSDVFRLNKRLKEMNVVEQMLDFEYGK